MNNDLEKYKPAGDSKITSWIYGNTEFRAALALFLPKILEEFTLKISNFRNPLIIGIACANDENCMQDGRFFKKGLIKLLNRHCNKVIVLWNGKPDGWKKLGWEDLTDNVIQYVSADFIGFIAGISHMIKGYTDDDLDWRPSKLLHRYQMEGLYNLIEDFSHNRTNDITNRFLAPAKMLLDAAKDSALQDDGAIDEFVNLANENKPILNEFIQQVCEQIKEDPQLYDYHGAMIRHYADVISSATYDKNALLNPGEREIRIRDIDQFMILLTECRVQAGGKIK